MNQEPAIIIVTYNRPACLQRILSSLNASDLAEFKSVQLVISIDGGGSTDVTSIAKRFEWRHGSARIIKHEKNIGLRKHILACGDLTNEYGSVVVLEEDCFVSRNFYNFAVRSLDYYRAEKRIAGISLYSPRYNEAAYMPFLPLDDGCDAFFMQVPTSLGQIWTRQHWEAFKTYYDRNPVIEAHDPLPPNVISWPDTSWKKYFYKYMLEEGLFLVYPAASRLTNFGDTGTHQSGESQLHQVPIETNRLARPLNFVPFGSSCNKYDGFYEILPESLRLQGFDVDEDTCVDLYGARPLDGRSEKYSISVKTCASPLRSYGANLFPLPLNLIYSVSGNDISYGKTGRFGALDRNTRWNLIQRSQPFGCHFGMMVAQSSRYYRTSYALTHPEALPAFLRGEFTALQNRVGRLRGKKVT